MSEKLPSYEDFIVDPKNRIVKEKVPYVANNLLKKFNPKEPQ